ncbi:hypothetical protein F3Y22_tig00111398pilonHSYRG00373 [Hibiscus syriacus]|uniref:Uncharacterized protein n=1 Tax=Hibiscus syriacus TaxID=106335 RepID=A0A6A2YL04_HIBSY|nr:DNA-binding protein HEXBP [Hibiscus syriacus]KAE8679707.1 hypothetical protein F3Y22_tig00111398pilonHSYRG00373 [Hibiscus syriacus]
MKRIIETEEEEAEFLSAVAAAEESIAKRRKPNQDDIEGAYTAALKGSKSSLWQQINPLTTSQSKSRVHGSAAAGTRGSGSEKSCPCGSGTCLILTANTERNRGRMFYKCPLRQENGGCGFFMWCDSDIASQTHSNGIPMHTKGSSGGSFESCKDQTVSTNALLTASRGYCNMNDPSNSAYTVRTGSSCFKCGKDGHWAKDCNVPSSHTPAKSGTCYKCDKPGHWAKDCTSMDAGKSSKTNG